VESAPAASVVVLETSGNDASAGRARRVARHELARHRGFTLLAVPVANSTLPHCDFHLREWPTAQS
jgi:hypothetical protein